MTPQERGPFERKAKEEKFGAQSEVQKYTSQGVRVCDVEKQDREASHTQKTMLATIRDIIKSSYLNNSIGSQKYYFIAGNYFCIRKDNFYPAELALIEFSLEYGVTKKYHTYLNPEFIPMGFLCDAKNHSEATHRLPLPPNAKGEKNYSLVLNDIKKLLGAGSHRPPMFTIKEQIIMLQSFFKSFCFENENPLLYRIYPVEHLFFELKEETSKNSIKEVSGFGSVHIAETTLTSDAYVYMSNTTCNYHDEIDCIKYCALSYTQRWAYTFIDHICGDLDIVLIPGQHLPAEIDVGKAYGNDEDNDSDTYEADNESQISNYATASAFTEAESERRYEDNHSVGASSAVNWPGATSRNYGSSSSTDDDFPVLGSRGRRRSSGSSQLANIFHRNTNPWNNLNSSNSSSDQDLFTDGFDAIQLGRGRGRGSELYRNSFQATRGRGNLNKQF